jgi:arsenate reductase
MHDYVLILCTGNSCRSQMAEGYLRKYLPNATVMSAGIEAHGLNYYAVRVMGEDGVDISHHASKAIDALPNLPWDLVLTVCDHARELCPILPGNHRKLHHSFRDPAQSTGSAEEVLPIYRSVRDDIREYIRELVESLTLDVKHT